ncbi:P-loop containing nucleoside triphosphate hydrolase protein [Sistotremastrum niveocremeum HHB9708]|uniref:p-loop containing nucleoside triphosphate hydrolase protein n=1 Tax=Sistotremastrum niveocremeum HHB9708 TaxID=1314777 RepID=A0A164RLN8_9AGAM|nr:P-loop containing nucleoside triphosphate hydrolase protein [Sistotremastrum niveocremeum HHB9708]
MKIEARNLSFAYPGATEPVLRNINLVIEPGETLAIVGFNGGGKTTLVKVLMGLFEHEGLLEIDGRDVREYNPQTLHHHTTACFQDFQRYNLSTRENVGVGNWKLITNDESLESAMKKGGALEIVEEVGGLDAELTMFGGSVRSTQAKPPPNQPKVARLSGGQWQRVALSRAFIRSNDATLVVFDEPSSALDARAEHELFERIHSLSSSENGERCRTTIYISHRFSTVRKADKIAVMENGTISEFGNHQSLMQLGGRYAEFFKLQADAFA